MAIKEPIPSPISQLARQQAGRQAAAAGGPPSTRWRCSMRGRSIGGRRAARRRAARLRRAARSTRLRCCVKRPAGRALARLGSQRQPVGHRPPAGGALGARGPEHRRAAGSSAAACSSRRSRCWAASDGVERASSTRWRRSGERGPEHRLPAGSSAAACSGRHRSRGRDQQSAGGSWLESSSPAASTTARCRVCSQQKTGHGFRH